MQSKALSLYRNPSIIIRDLPGFVKQNSLINDKNVIKSTTEIQSHPYTTQPHAGKPDLRLRDTLDKAILFVFHNVYPREQEVTLFGLALNGLGSGNDRKPLLNVLLSGIALLAEQIKVLVGLGTVALQAEQQIGARHIGGSVALGGMRPVEDIQAAVLGNDDVGRVEVTVADLVVLRHGFKARMKLIARGGVKIRLGDLAVHLIL